MKINNNFVLRKIADDFVLVPIGKSSVDFGGLIMLNESGALLWEHIEKDNDISKDALAEVLCREYDVDRETAFADTEQFIKYMVENEIFTEQ